MGIFSGSPEIPSLSVCLATLANPSVGMDVRNSHVPLMVTTKTAFPYPQRVQMLEIPLPLLQIRVFGYESPAFWTLKIHVSCLNHVKSACLLLNHHFLRLNPIVLVETTSIFPGETATHLAFPPRSHSLHSPASRLDLAMG